MATTAQPTRLPGQLQGLFLRLRRHTSSGLYIPELDGLRFIAIFLVFLFHLSGDVVRHNPPGVKPPDSFLYALTQECNVGVPLFFAISGMILGMPFARYWLLGGPKISLQRYFMRRLTRLEPPYIAALLLLTALKYFGHRGTMAELLPHLGASLLYIHNIVYREMSSINPVSWSLEVEVQFYILAPLLATVFAIRSAWLRRGLLTAAIATAAFLSPWTDMAATRGNTGAWMAHLSLAGNIQYFLTGFLLAELFLLLPTSEYRDRRWDLVSLIGWPLLAISLVEAPQFAYIALPGMILALYVAVFYGSYSRAALASAFVATIGGMCYSIYLLHNYAIAVLGFATERIGQTLPFWMRLITQGLLMAPVVLIISVLFYKLVEQPCMQSDWPARLRNFLRRGSKVPTHS